MVEANSNSLLNMDKDVEDVFFEEMMAELKAKWQANEDNLEQSFEVRVPIKNHLRHMHPFGAMLPSNLSCAIILSFMGNRMQVCRILQ